MIVIGIDPGKTGGFAVLDGGEVSLVKPMPEDLSELVDTLDGRNLLICTQHIFIEKAQSFPKQGIASAFNYGVHFGHLLGILMAQESKHTQVNPRIWTKTMHIGTAAGFAKKRSLEACRRLFPEVNLCVGKSKKAHDGIVDALLIAEWGRRQLQGGKA